MSERRPHLRELADRCGILPGYESTDHCWHETTEATMEALLGAMAIDASTEEAAARALRGRAAAGAAPPGDDETSSCLPVAAVIGESRAYGLTANLYTLRSARNWGVGDLSDLTRLIEWAGRCRAAFVGINPIQAMSGGDELNPYYPSSRLYRDPIYLDVEAVPEFAMCGAAREQVASAAFRESLRRHRAATHLQWRTLAATKDAIMRHLYRQFTDGRDASSERGREFESYCRREGAALRDFATYAALAERFGAGACDWRSWPSEFRRRDAAAVDAFRRAQADRVEYFAYLQFELDRQLGQAAEVARASNVPLGIFGDLPVGCAPDGADTWSHPDAFAVGVSLGAPPDAYSSVGQDWGLAPLRVDALVDDGGYWRGVVERAMRHCGAIRLDHAMGVVRQFWIPAGSPPVAGAYVACPTAAVVRVLATESRNNRCVVVAEDLGTVPHDFRHSLKRWGMLRNQIVYFERSHDRFHGSNSYEIDALAAANNHDLPPLAGYWSGDDLTLRESAGLLGGEELAVARADRDGARGALVAVLRDEGVVSNDWWPADPGMLAAAVHTFVASAPSRLVALSLDDLAGERLPVNIPGAAPAQLPSWRRRMGTPIEALQASSSVSSTLERIATVRGTVAIG
jgi:4-alpha-glucanotransferase